MNAETQQGRERPAPLRDFRPGFLTSPAAGDQTSLLAAPLTCPLSAALWAISARVMSQVVRFVSATVIARLLRPSDFGLVAMAMAFSGFAAILTDVGLRAAIVQFRDLDRAGLSTTFWLSGAIGAVVAVTLSLASPFIADFAQMSALSSMLVAIACGLFFSAITAVPLGVMNLRMEFRKTALVEIASETSAACVAIGLALHGARHWALVGQSLVSSSMTCFLCYAVSRWRPSFEFDNWQARRVIRFSTSMLGFNTLNYWARSLDALLIGRYWGSGPLGYYNRAYSLMMYPYSMLHTSVSPVLHSTLSAMQQDIPRMRQTYLKLARISLMVSLPIGATFAVLAEPLILTIWGPQWMPSVGPFRLLCVVSAIQPLLAASGNVYLASGRADLLLKFGAVYIVAVCTGFVSGVRWGIAGVAVGYAVANVLVIPPTLSFIVRRLLGGRNRDLLRQASTPAACAVAAAVCAAACNYLLGAFLPIPARLAAGLAVSAAAVLATACALDLSFVKDCISVLPPPMRRFVYYRDYRN